MSSNDDETWQAQLARIRETADLDAPLEASVQRWTDRQITALRDGELHEDKRSALRAAGITASTPTRAERIFLDELDWWADSHGTAFVPQAALTRPVEGRPYPLGAQVRRARLARRRGSLSVALAEELPRRPGWSWDGATTREARSWEEHYAQLRAFVEEHDRLPPLGSAVYKWLMRQRVKLDTLTPARRQRLQAVPGALERGDTRVPQFVGAARGWLERNPERTLRDLRYAETVDVDGEPYPLGRRATYYRRRGAGLEGTHPLPAEEIAAIESLPGWSWQLRPVRNRHREPGPQSSPPQSPGA